LVQTTEVAVLEEELKVRFTPSNGMAYGEPQLPPVCANKHKGWHRRIRKWYFIFFIGLEIELGYKIIAKTKQSQPAIVILEQKGHFPGWRPYFFGKGNRTNSL